MGPPSYASSSAGNPLVLFDIARLRLERGDSAAALAAVQVAIREGIGLLRGQDVEMTPLFQGKGRDLCDLGFRAVAVLLPGADASAQPALVAEAIRIAELGRAMGLSRALGGGRSSLDAELPPRLRQEHAWRRERVRTCHRAVLERRSLPGTAPADAAGPVFLHRHSAVAPSAPDFGYAAHGNVLGTPSACRSSTCDRRPSMFLVRAHKGPLAPATPARV